MKNQVKFNASAGAWSVNADYQARWAVSSTQTYGTDAFNAVELFEQALNQQVPTVYDTDPFTKKRTVNQKETITAREKQQLLKDKFQEWLWADEERAKKLVRLYNDRFNSLVTRKYDGSHLVLPGYAGPELRPHQRDAIWRIVTGRANTLLAHVVGAGKTLAMICAGMELRRLGRAAKPMYVVPNHMLEHFAAEFIRAYPGARILMASKDDLQGDRRRELVSRIATGDWDGVLITHASFERIKMSDDVVREFIENEIADIEAAIRAEKEDSRDNRIVKELAKQKKAWEAKLAKLSAKEKKDDLLSFEDLGVDWLFVDEAHLFKNLYRFTKMTRVAGLPNSNSERAFDMFLKTRHVMGKHGMREGIVFATGTPVSNSMAEMWVMQRFLQPSTLEAHQIGMFDTWASNFGESVTALELAPDGSGYRMQTRFAKFVNLPELLSIFREVADIRTAEMLNLPVPNAVKETVTAKPTPELKAFVDALVKRAEKIRSGSVSPSVDNMLAVTNDGRKAALDMRLVDPLASDAPRSKVNLCAQKVHEVWLQTAGKRGTQIVFCDLSTPQSAGFSVYHDLRDKLVAMGVPQAEIAFIHDYESDAAKEELFKAVREGRVRVLLGSTGKMGVGTNVQTRLVALHHLDAPWRPADVEQREGRIIRQGNRNDTVWIYRYVTEGSFDAYIWQTLETKARFIAQVMQGDTGARSAEDVELAALSYAEVKALASGNPLVLEKAGVDTELAKLTLLKSQWDQQQWRNKQDLAYIPKRIEHLQAEIAAIEADMSANTGNLAWVVGKARLDRKQVAVALWSEAFRDTFNDRIIGQIGTLSIVAKSNVISNDARIVLRGNTEYEVPKAKTPGTLVARIEGVIASMPELLQEKRNTVATLEKRAADLREQIQRPFDKAERLAYLRQRQKEIDALLDLTKGDLAAVDEAEAEAA